MNRFGGERATRDVHEERMRQINLEGAQDVVLGEMMLGDQARIRVRVDNTYVFIFGRNRKEEPLHLLETEELIEASPNFGPDHLKRAIAKVKNELEKRKVADKLQEQGI